MPEEGKKEGKILQFDPNRPRRKSAVALTPADQVVIEMFDAWGRSEEERQVAFTIIRPDGEYRDQNIVALRGLVRELREGQGFLHPINYQLAQYLGKKMDEGNLAAAFISGGADLQFAPFVEGRKPEIALFASAGPPDFFTLVQTPYFRTLERARLLHLAAEAFLRLNAAKIERETLGRRGEKDLDPERWLDPFRIYQIASACQIDHLKRSLSAEELQQAITEDPRRGKMLESFPEGITSLSPADLRAIYCVSQITQVS